MKAALPHRVPLSDETVAIVGFRKSFKLKDDGLVFTGGKKLSPLSDVSLSQALRGAADGVTVHGCRSTFRDWAAEKTAYPREVTEAALAHTNRDKTEAAYRRSDLFEQRASLMRDWSLYAPDNFLAHTEADLIVAQ